MFEYFKALTKDISSIANDTIVKLLEQKRQSTIKGEGFDIRKIVYAMFFRNATILEMVKNSSNGSFLQRFNSFQNTKDILSYSFVRHPFDR